MLSNIALGNTGSAKGMVTEWKNKDPNCLRERVRQEEELIRRELKER